MILAVLFSVPTLALLATAICEDNRILVSREGISFPVSFLPGLRFKREYRWSEVSGLHLRWEGAAAFIPSDCIDLFFQNNGHARIYLNDLARGDLEQLLLAINLFAGNQADEYLLLQLQTHLRGGAAEEKRLSITELWEEEIASRFAPTSFETLKVDSWLRSKSIRIVKLLGFGGFSATYLAQMNGRELVVLKEAAAHTNNGQEPDTTAVELLKYEAAVLSQIEHPQIPKLFDHFVDSHRHYLALQYIAGQDLRQLVRHNGPQLQSDVIEWARRVCQILEYLHGRNPPILHLDLTPENLMLRGGEIFLIDFGVAHEASKTKFTAGKKSYMAPEHLGQQPVIQSDIYSLGGSMHFLLTGRDPAPQTVASPRRINQHVTEEMNNIVEECTAISIDKRIPSFKALRHKLDALGG